MVPAALLLTAGALAAGVLTPGSIPAAVAGTSPTKVLLIVEENHSDQQATAGMPYLASLGRAYGVATDYRAVTHPSLPNYLALAAGSTFGIRDDANPSSHRLTGPTVFDRAIAAGRTAKVYAEAMPGPCGLSPSGRYAVKHNPWTYFRDTTSRANCQRFDVPSGTVSSGALRSDVLAGRLPTVGMLIPDLCHDAHDCSLGTADAWLKSWMDLIKAAPDFRAGRLAVVITFDEDDRASGNRVLTTVVAPGTRGVRAASSYTHYSWTRYAGEIAGAPLLREGSRATSLRPGFRL